MKWTAVVLFVAALALFAWGRSTRAAGRSADERAGADFLYLAGAVVIAADILLLAGWAVVQLLSA